MEPTRFNDSQLSSQNPNKFNSKPLPIFEDSKLETKTHDSIYLKNSVTLCATTGIREPSLSPKKEPKSFMPLSKVDAFDTAFNCQGNVPNPSVVKAH